jgi:hypothetical protein
MPDWETACLELSIQLRQAVLDIARLERKLHMAEVRIDPVRARRSVLSAALDDADRRIRFYEDLRLDRELSLDEEAAAKTAADDRVKLSKQALDEYKDDPKLAVGDRAIADNPLVAPQVK